MTRLSELKKTDLIIGETYYAKLNGRVVLEAKLDQIDNGHGYSILSRVDKPEYYVLWNITNPPKGLRYYKKDAGSQ